MTNRLPIALAAALLLAACGNKADLLMPSEVPPEDAGRFLIKSSVPTQAQREADEDAAWDEADAGADQDVDDAQGAQDDATAPAVPVIRDVPASSGTP
ncbi:lipoprotein [Luteimonas sp. FCS-9]|uniref:LPS translocon maturation chaperone LptM n=1 Tax=Luteimonas sp. FCS-9 TaxID=1547516 RepID=UPI00069B9EA3|nr:lipoprotein [Luteimonas sp. FCS-9]